MMLDKEESQNIEDYNMPDTPSGFNAGFSTLEFPDSLKDDINNDLSILLASTDDINMDSTANIDALFGITSADLNFNSPSSIPTIPPLPRASNRRQQKTSHGKGRSRYSPDLPMSISEVPFYQHSNSHIIPTSIASSKIDTTVGVNVDNTSTIVTDTSTALIDTLLLDEIDSVLNDSRSPTIKSIHKVVKKPSFKRLQQQTIHQNAHTHQQSPASPRVSKQHTMAQAAAMLAATSKSAKKLNNLQKHESARAAARAVGQNAFTPKQVVSASPTMTLSMNFKNATKTNSPSRPNNTPISASNSLNNTNLPPNFTNQINHTTNSFSGLNIINSKPSSSSIFSFATGFSNNSKFSDFSKDSSTFDMIPIPHGSTETLETVESREQNNKKYHAKSQYPTIKETTVNQFVSKRTNSVDSSASTSSMNSLSEYLNISTPSPDYTNISNTTFTPTNPNSARKMSFDNSPITPVSRTTAKFAQLSTKSPINTEPNYLETLIENGPKISTWKTPTSQKSVAKKSTVRHTSLEIENMKGFNIIDLSVNNSKPRTQSMEIPKQMNSIFDSKNPNNKFEEPIKYTRNHSTGHMSGSNYTHNNIRTAKMHNYTPPVPLSSDSTNSTTSTMSMNSMPPNVPPLSYEQQQSKVAHSKPMLSNNVPKRKLSDAPFQSLISTFNKNEPEEIKPQVYSNMNQGLLEFQVNIGSKK